MGTGMGIGLHLPQKMLIKRKFRWTFETLETGNGSKFDIRPIFVKVAARPNITSEELELNFLNEKAWISGKPSWDPLSITIIDAKVPGSNGADAAASIRRWFRAVYNFDDPQISGAMSSPAEHYKINCLLKMYDGVGDTMEEWKLFGVWPQQVNWGDLDYSNNDSADIEVTLRFDNAQYTINDSVPGGMGLDLPMNNTNADPTGGGGSNSGSGTGGSNIA